MKSRALTALLALLILMGVASGASATKPKPAPKKKATDSLPLHLGSVGPRVVQLDELLAGKGGNVFKGIKGTYAFVPNDLFGPRTEAALYAYKYRLGYPMRFNVKGKAVAGPDLFDLLLGKQNRTIEMVALAQLRIQAVAAGSTVLAQQIKRLENSQLGASETNHSNCGPIIDRYFAYFHTPCGQPWCAIFQQWAFAVAGVAPPFADRSFYVPFIASWAEHYVSKAHPHGLLEAKARVGDLVAFLDDGGHIGFVVKVLASGYVTDEGNSSDRVSQVYHPWNSRLRVFIAISGVA